MSNGAGYHDFQQHLAALDAAGLLLRIDAPVNKDTELHPLVRWQFRGGLDEAQRKAFLFTNVVDARGRRYEMPVAVGALAANAAIYAIGMGVELDAIGATWERGVDRPIAPVEVTDAPCQEVVLTGAELEGDGRGLDALPVPISTPGFDCAPYFTAGNFITRDPETGIQNLGTYRGGLKSSTRMVVRMATRAGGAGGYPHWEKYRARGEKMPCAMVVGCPPAIAYTGPQKLPRDVDELAVAGGLVGEPIRVVRARTVDLLVPAEAEIVVEGLIDTELLEPEAPFGESHGHIALEDFNLIFEVTAITRRRDAVLASIVSQVTPSESSVMKRVAYEPMFLAFLRRTLGIKGVRNVVMHEPLTNLRRVLFLVMDQGTPTPEVWRALRGAASLRADCGKYVIAVNEDIDPRNADAVFWSFAYRANPGEDVMILPYRDGGHGPQGGTRGSDATMLVDATLKQPMPPLALPKEEYMTGARALWERLGLPPLKPETPWHGYDLGDWSTAWDEGAARAVAGDYMENGRRSAELRRGGVKPNSSVRDTLRRERETDPGKP